MAIRGRQRTFLGESHLIVTPGERTASSADVEGVERSFLDRHDKCRSLVIRASSWQTASACRVAMPWERNRLVLPRRSEILLPSAKGATDAAHVGVSASFKG